MASRLLLNQLAFNFLPPLLLALIATGQCFAQSKDSPCPDLEAIKAATKPVAGHPDLTDYRICKSARDCAEVDCSRAKPMLSAGAKVPAVSDERAFKSASRPFVMCRAPGTAFKCNATLFHGLTDSPQTLLAAAEKLSADGCNVVIPLLSGHGADSIGEMNGEPTAMTKQNWNRDVQNGIELTRKLFGPDNAYIGGFSTGGALSLDYIKTHAARDNGLKGVIAFDPVVALPCTPVGAGICADTVAGAADYDPLDWGMNLVARYVLNKDSQTGVDTPARIPLYHPMEATKALAHVIQSIRAKGTMYDTPTLAFFSSGKSEEPNKYTTDAQFGKKIICGTPSRGVPSGGLLSNPNSRCPSTCKAANLTYSSLRHNQVPLSAKVQYGSCVVGDPKLKTYNPGFSCMMSQISKFMDQQNSTSNSPTPPAVHPLAH